MHKWPWQKKRAPLFEGADQSSPENFVLSFARDYKKWNDFCCDQDSKQSDGQSRRDSMAEYGKLYSGFLSSFLAVGVDLQLISYGSTASFDPVRISFMSTEDNERAFGLGIDVMADMMNMLENHLKAA